ncbi:hypothetical protein [Methylocaldum gracile]|jgi:hypothetical protein|uniref:hypothetical protein n=1 Tax=unclassified Methylocaldum TaxID=2622260 RepID=UPI00105FA6BC
MEVTITLRDDPLAENPDNVAVELKFDPPLTEAEKVSPAAVLATRFTESVWHINETGRWHGLATRSEKTDGH